MDLQILIACVINYSHGYETTPSCYDISISNVSPGNESCLSSWHLDPEISQLGMIHDWQLASISEEAQILDLLHDYGCSKIRIVVAMHGSCNFFESIPFETNKRPHGLTSSTATLTLGSEIRPSRHIIEMHLKVPPISMWNKNDVKPVENIWENDWRPELWSITRPQMTRKLGRYSTHPSK